MNRPVNAVRNIVPREETTTNNDETGAPSGVYAQALPPLNALDRFMDHMLKMDASDLYLTVGSPPVFRTAGIGIKGKKPVTTEQINAIFEEALTDAQKIQFDLTCELNFAAARGEGRYRVNVLRQRGEKAMVIRLVRTRIKTLDELGYPAAMKQISLSRRGLVLVVGGTGSGKSTALAAMIDHRNTTETGHILTIEDPIEFIHPHKSCVVTQRELGADTLSVEAALKNALRQAPDVVLIGEIRDRRTMEAALELAETGHLCISTLHANNADQTVERVLNFFPADRHAEVRAHLALNLRAVVSQRLVPTVDGKRAAALEIMVDTPRVKQLIKSGDVSSLKDAMEQSAGEGCRTFDASLFELFAAGRVSEEQALKASDSPNNVRLRIERWKESDGRATSDSEEPPLRLLPDSRLNLGP
jgi:twitching motility protein PilU